MSSKKLKPSSREKMCRKKSEKKVRLEHDFAGIKAGQMMFVATPQIVDNYIRKIPFGETRTIQAMRNRLARQHHCDAACPVSTSIFIRMSAEAALEDLADGLPESEVAPFWRLLNAEDKISKRLNIDPEWISTRRALEAKA